MKPTIFSIVLLTLIKMSKCILLQNEKHLFSVESTGIEGEPLFLTPFLEKNQLEEAQSKSRVLPMIANVTSYSGFFTVNKECESNLFFWFFPAQMSNWEEPPVLLWLQGGPGSSSMIGVFQEHGPFEVTKEGLQIRQYTWNKKFNVLYIDQPVGAGFSFTGRNCYPDSQDQVRSALYQAIVQFYQLFPQLTKNKFFISGESFGGHFVPALGYTIHKNNPTARVKINLATMVIGNGWSDPITQSNYGPLLYELGLIDDVQKSKLQSLYDKFVHDVTTKDNRTAYISSENLRMTMLTYLGRISIVYNFLPKPKGPPLYWQRFLQTTEVRTKLKVGNLSFSFLNDVTYDKLSYDTVYSVKPWIEELLEHYPIVFYNGQLDIICAYTMTTEFLRSLKWTRQELYLEANRTKWCVDQEQAGYLKGQHNLYDVLVRGAGHAVPADQPRWAFELINSIVSGPPNDPFHMLNKCSWNFQ